MFNNALFSISKDYILRQVGEEAIFKKYLGIEPTDKGQFINPKRVDKNPDCSFYINQQGRWIFKDFAGGFTWDCFNVVEYEYGCSFKEALIRIAIDFGLLDGNTEQAINFINSQPKKSKQDVEIRIKRRSWNKEDIKFWKQFYIDENTLAKYNVSPISNAWKIERGILIPMYYYKPSDPCYCYHFYDYHYKLYFPFRERARFIQTSSNYVQGYNQLPEIGENLLITKSLKDVMSISNFSNDFDLYSIAPLSESITINSEQFSDLYNRFDNIATLFDFDRAGIRLMRKYESIYKLPYYFFGNEFRKGTFVSRSGIKDFSDFIKFNGIDNTKKLIEKYINKKNDGTITFEQVFS